MDLHLCSIPFENLEVFDAGRIPSLRSEDIYEKIIVRKRGGYCFELNKLFYELLKALDFRVIPVAVRICGTGELPRSCTGQPLLFLRKEAITVM